MELKSRLENICRPIYFNDVYCPVKRLNDHYSLLYKNVNQSVRLKDGSERTRLRLTFNNKSEIFHSFFQKSIKTAENRIRQEKEQNFRKKNKKRFTRKTLCNSDVYASSRLGTDEMDSERFKNEKKRRLTFASLPKKPNENQTFDSFFRVNKGRFLPNVYRV